MPASFQLDRSSSSLLFEEPLLEVELIERPNRYVAQLALPDGTVQRGHVPVGGRIGGLTLDGLPALVSGPYSGRSTDYTVEAIGSHYEQSHPQFQWIGINQTASNRYVESLLRAGLLPELTGELPLHSLRAERILGGKRIDFSLGESDPAELWIEVKTPLISLTAPLASAIPVKLDYGKGAPSQRLPEQFDELAKIRRAGSRAVLLGVFGYATRGQASAEARYLANLNLEGLAQLAAGVGIELWELELEVSRECLRLSGYRELTL